MGDLMNYYTGLIEDHADPRVKQWHLLDGPGPTLYISAAYLLLILLILPAHMKNRKPYELTTLIRCYNILQVVSCFTLFLMYFTSGWVQGEYSWGCQVVDYSEKPHAMSLVKCFYWLYWLKMLELVETIFFVLRKKFEQVSALHIYHHVSSFILSYVVCKFIGGGMFSIQVMMNLIIHVFMYSYYFLSSYGPKWQKKLAPWKPRLTVAQMVQFTLMLIHSALAFQPGCKVPKPFFMVYFPNIILIFKMFYDFYQKSYNKKHAKHKAMHGEKMN